MKYCSKCRINLPETYTFCKSCGGRLVTLSADTSSDWLVCPSCGSEIKTGWRFCKQCAYDLSDGSGSRDSAARSCSYCGSIVGPQLKFCENCGKPVAVSNGRPAIPSGKLRLASAAATEVMQLPPQGLSAAAVQDIRSDASEAPMISDPVNRHVGADAVSEAPTRLQTSHRLWVGLLAASAVVLLGVAAFLSYHFWYSTRRLEQKLDAAIAQGNLVKPEGMSAYDYYQQLMRNGADESLLARYEVRLVPMLAAQPLKMLEDFAVPTNKEPELAEWQAALRPIAWASEMKPNDNGLAARAKYIEGRVAYKNKQNDQALDLWSRASDLDRSWAIPPNSVGIIYNERKDWQTARQYLLDAIRRDSNWAVPYNNVGTSFFLERNDHQALSYYQQAVERAPNWARPHAWLGDLAMRKKDYGVAVEEYQKVLDLAHPDNTSLDLDEIRKRLDQAKTKSQQGAAHDSLIQK